MIKQVKAKVNSLIYNIGLSDLKDNIQYIYINDMPVADLVKDEDGDVTLTFCKQWAELIPQIKTVKMR